MSAQDYWSRSTVALMGGGSFGIVLAQLAAKNAQEVRVWVREESLAREINSTRINSKYAPGMQLSPKIRASSDLERVFENGVNAVIWALPSKVARSQARALAKYFDGSEILFHATKGVEEGTLKRMSEVLREELPCPRIGVISGPNLAEEIGRGQPAATVIASNFEEVIAAGQELLSSEAFRVYGASDVIGVEWAGTLKNVLAIAAGAVDEMKLGGNARAVLITRGLAEMVRFGTALGAKQDTFLGLAGVGDLLATCSSVLSRNYRVGVELARGRKIDEILATLGSTAEGVRTTQSVFDFARSRGIDMPITEGVYLLLKGEMGPREALKMLMTRPQAMDAP